MKRAIILLTFFSTVSAFSSSNCEQKSKEAALSLYHLNSGVIQGGDADVEFVSSEIKDEVRTNIIAVHDQNDEGDYWTIKYKVKFEKNSCYIKLLQEVGVKSYSSDD